MLFYFSEFALKYICLYPLVNNPKPVPTPSCYHDCCGNSLASDSSTEYLTVIDGPPYTSEDHLDSLINFVQNDSRNYQQTFKNCHQSLAAC